MDKFTKEELEVIFVCLETVRSPNVEVGLLKASALEKTCSMLKEHLNSKGPQPPKE